MCRTTRTGIYWENCNLQGEISFEGLTALESLFCGNNKITSLDVSENTELEYWDCRDNPLTSLDLTNNTMLERLWCDSTVTVTGYNDTDEEEEDISDIQ